MTANIQMVYIFTEMVRCGEIGKQAVESFRKHHPNLTLHVYLAAEDVNHIPSHPNVVLHNVEEPIYSAFNAGHLGTSMLWTSVILASAPHEQIVHFDSDVFFTGNLVDDILEELRSHDIVGSFRPYRLNPNNRDDVRCFSDVTQTYCFGFKRNKITITDPVLLQQMVQGMYWKHPIIDFFDPVSFHMLENGASIRYIDVDVIGGVNHQGGRENKLGSENVMFDVGSKITHFAGVGSGRNFATMIRERKPIQVPRSYIDFGLKRYDIYSRIFFGKAVLPTCVETLTPTILRLSNADTLHQS